jgi:hypothetical protein
MAKDCFFMRAGFLGGLANGHRAFHFEASFLASLFAC